MSNIQTGAERMPHDLSHLGFLAGQIGRLITIATFFFSSRRRHTIFQGDWSSDVCSSDLQLYDGATPVGPVQPPTPNTTVTVTGLTAGTAYTFTVKAQNGGGDSSESVHSAAFTPTKVTEIGKGSCRERG